MPQYSPGFLPIDAWPLPMLCRPSTTVHSVLFGTDAKGPCGRPPQRLILVLRLAFGLYLQRGGLALDALHEVRRTGLAGGKPAWGTRHRATFPKKGPGRKEGSQRRRPPP